MENLTLAWYIDWVKNWNLDPAQVLESYIEKSKNSDLNAYITISDEYAKKNLETQKSKPLAWAPVWVKDLILTKDIKTTCGSKILKDYIAPYSATCFENLENSWASIIWKTNLDEFAMGSSNETSYFWNVLNPLDKTRIPGWSSGWSAAVVAWDLALASLWTDTWGSIRQPWALCGVVGIKPTYWVVSRYWVQSMTSSLDQVWTFTKTTQDWVVLLNSICGYDIRDSQSLKVDTKIWFEALEQKDLKWMKIAFAKQFFSSWIEENVKQKILENIEQLKILWAQVDEIDFPLLDSSLSVYYIICPAEVSTNLSRYDWIRYWLQKNTFDYENIQSYYQAVRSEGFWDEVKRRILMWTFVLSAGYYDAYYNKATKVRQKLTNQFEKFFQDYDAIVGPTSPSVAWKFWEKSDDPLKMYLSDIYTIPANLAGLPAMSLPVWNVAENDISLPVGFHIMAWKLQEHKMFRIANVLEKNLA